MGDLDAARPHALFLTNLAEMRTTRRSHVCISLVPISCLSYLEGNWRAPRQHSDRGLEASPETRNSYFPSFCWNVKRASPSCVSCRIICSWLTAVQPVHHYGLPADRPPSTM